MKTPAKFNMAYLPTPLETISFEGNKFFVKRDDLTELQLTGNKVRKLEYLIKDAVKNKAEYIYTCGGSQSNHCRATVLAAARYGIKTKLFLWGKESEQPEGNLFFDKLYRAEIEYLTKKEYDNVNQIMTGYAEEAEKSGKKVYTIPEGGSTTLGIWGYINFMFELSKQTDLTKIKGIYLAAGTGGTAAGILLGAALLNLKLTVFIDNVLYSAEEIFTKIEHLVEGTILDYNLECKVDMNKLVVVSDYSTEGYKSIAPYKLDLIRCVASETGLLLDPAYTGKAFFSYYNEVLNEGFGKKVIFLHTGGLFGIFGRKKEYLDF